MEQATTHQQAFNLPDPQRLAIEAFLTGARQAEAAQAARVCVRTLQRWLQQEVFINALHQARSATWIEASTRLQARANHAVDTLDAVMDCDRPHARVMAARAVLTLANKAFELETLFGRALEVERQLDEYQGRTGGGHQGGSTHPVPAPAGTPQGTAATRFQPAPGFQSVAEAVSPNAERPTPKAVSHPFAFSRDFAFSRRVMHDSLTTRHQTTKHDITRLPGLLAQRFRRTPQPEGRPA
jgi:hypothetical protein